MTPDERRLIRGFHTRIEQEGVSLPVALMMIRLAEGDGPTTGELADSLMLSDPAVSRMRRKAPAGTIQAEPIDDRSFRLYLTDEGRALLGRLVSRDDDDDL